MARTSSAGRASTSMRGRAEGPVQGACEVLGTRRLGAYHSLTLVAPEVAKRAQPGQFVSLAVGVPDTVLRRPFSIYAVTQRGSWAGTIEVVFDIVGPGTRWLAERRRYDVVDVVGPLGRPFPLPQRPVPVLLVGGGYGSAPLLYLAGALRGVATRTDMILGAATERRIFNAIDAKRIAASAIFTTEDGSAGTRGRVTDVMDEVIDVGGTAVIYACGPMPMLAAVSAIARRRRIPCQVAVEEEMACGVGVCWTCVVPYERAGASANVRACVDGPVFNGARVRWDLLGSGAAAAAEATPVPDRAEEPAEEFTP